ncbi:MAG: AAA family ATPase [Novosphingobium sp.]
MTVDHPVFAPDMFASERDPFDDILTSDSAFERHRATTADRVMAEMAAGRAAQAKSDAERLSRDNAARETFEARSTAERGDAVAEPAVVAETVNQDIVSAFDIKAHDAAKAEREAANAAHWEAFDRPDADYLAHEIALDIRIDGVADDGNQLGEFADPTGWELTEDVSVNSGLVENLKSVVVAAIEPWVSQYRSLGLMRADLVDFSPGGTLGDGHTWPRYFLIHRADDASLSAATLADFSPVICELSSPSGASVMVSASTQPLNATMLFGAMQRGGGGVGIWGGEDTPDMDPAPGESRDAWLERVCLDRSTLERSLKAWARCGGNPRLFRAIGAASGRVAQERPIRWIVSGLIPRGYVTLLVGTKQAGKSTLLGELLAVVDSECQSTRSLLGTEIIERGTGALVSGEDGYDFIAARNSYYEPVHGEAQGFVFVTAEEPWPEVIKLLYEIPKGDIAVIGIDGLRAVMPGDEDSSGATSQFFDELNALAQHHNCAIVLIHHLSKSVVRSLSAMLPAVRGSGAITDRVRVAIGMIDRGSDITEIGIIKHNIPPSEDLWGEVNVGKLFRRDAATLTLVPLEPGGRAIPVGSSDAAADAVLVAVEYFNRTGVTLRRTGKHELFEQRPPQLAGVSRAMIREMVVAHLAAGRLTDGPDGIRAVGDSTPLTQ